ncbi:MAG: hypothetical protein KBB01_03375 [Candidatus Omnitrophica bacterium]|jgi:hypothetical protein|nr:hypothetical protein [Candidatus Omnitrophota bacterium]
MWWILGLIAITIGLVYLLKKPKESAIASRLEGLESDIQSLRVPVINYLESCKKRLETRLNDFSENKNRLRIVTREDMVKAIHLYEDDLTLDEKYKQLSEKLKDNLGKRVELATSYYNFLFLIDNWRKDNANLGANILDKDGSPSYNAIAKLQEIRDYFNNLLKSLI